MNFKELLKYPVEEVSFDFSQLFGYRYTHIPEIGDERELGANLDYGRIKDQTRIKINYLKDHCFDGRRVWQLYYVTFDEKLVMFCNNAGREGDDHYSRKVFDKELYLQMLEYIKTFIEDGFEDVDDLGTTEDDASAFFEFYGNRLSGHFEYH